MALQLQFRLLRLVSERGMLLTFMTLSHKCSIVAIKVLSTFIHQSFSPVSRSKIYEKSLN